MAAVDLVFAGAPLSQPAPLVFGDDGSNPISDALVTGHLALPLIALQARIALGFTITASLGIPSITLVSGAVEYSSQTQRPLVGQATVRWQDAEEQDEATQQRFQDGEHAPSGRQVRFQDGVGLQESTMVQWLDSDRSKRDGIYVRFQDGIGMPEAREMGFSDTIRGFRPHIEGRFQDGAKVRFGAAQRFQDATRGIAGQHRMRYQDAVPYVDHWLSVVGSGKAINNGWKTRYQDAKSPRPGVSDIDPVEPPELCYYPDSDLLFSMPWRNDTNLVFICEEHGTNPPEPGETIVVPVKKVYVVLNTATLHRVDGNVLLPTFSMSMSLDVDSWTWSFSASLPGRALPDLEPDGDGTPVLVEAVINAVPYRFLVEKIGRERAFASDGLRVTGRGIAAELDAPIAPIQSFGNTIDRTAQQLMGDVLTLNGVPLPGWTVDWQMEDWLVAANAWKKQGTYIEALNEIVAAAGGYLQPTPASKTVRALPRYPALPWDWADVTPDYELPSAAFTRESIDWTEKARYDRVYVSGQGTGGRLVNVRRAGTAGEIVAPMVTDSLITDTIAGRQRGGAILADTGRIANYSLRGAAGVRDVDNNPVGIIPPGKFVLYTDNGVEKLGITRSVSVEVQMPDIWQTIGVETHE